MNLTENLNSVRFRIRAACARVDRREDEVTLIAVTKTVASSSIQLAIDNGVKHIGENRVQDAESKIQELGPVATWHLIGHLQTNKAKKAVQLFDFIHSVDSFHLAQEISLRAEQAGKKMKCLIEVNTSGEESKYGVHPEDALDLVRRIASLRGISIQGLMTIGAFLPDAEQVRPCFNMLRQVSQQITSADVAGVAMTHLSMGMTNDFEVAIEEGATMIRVGRAIFGER